MFLITDKILNKYKTKIEFLQDYIKNMPITTCKYTKKFHLCVIL